ncbi:MAG: glycosyltransferase family 2 protein [Myxococcales bacterium]|nr:glycosyltransferase family 2 protein [Myxococcales bacterium]
MSSEQSSKAPYISIIIPIYNEEEILRGAVNDLREGLVKFGHTYEILLAENGSTDSTVALAAEIADEVSEPGAEVSSFSVNEPNYGKALRQGILKARGEFVICDEIDLCDLDFYTGALNLLLHDKADMVVGSKAMRGAHDNRPMFRRAATRVINGLLRVAVDFRGTDTHGLKAFRRDLVVPVVDRCVVDRDIFASELVVRAGRAKLDVVEIPVEVHEKRRPAINLFRRVPGVMKNLARLTYAIRIEG